MSERLLLSAAVQLLLHRHPSRATDKCSLTQSSLRTQTQQIRPLLQWEREGGKETGCSATIARLYASLLLQIKQVYH